MSVCHTHFSYVNIRRLTAIVFVAVLTLFLFTPEEAHAQATMPAGVCTTDPSFNIPTQLQLFSLVTENIACVLYGTAYSPGCSSTGSVAGALFAQITNQNTFVTIIRASLSLFVIIYGLSFMLGIVQSTYMEFLTRIIKFGVVLTLLTPAAWGYFYNTVGLFFQNGTNWLIGISAQFALNGIAIVDPTKPFMLLDYAIATAFSSKMFVTIVAMFYTPPYGFVFGFLVLMGLMSFVSAIFQGVWIYLMSMIIRAFLFGLAPIFIPFVLFSRTRHLFDGWLNQLVMSMLQPVLLFTFFSFFSILVLAAANNILQIPVCYLPGTSIWSGLPNDEVLPRFKIWMNGAWQDYARGWGPSSPTEFPGLGVAFPVSIVDVLAFLILAQLAWRFNGISISIAKELSATSTSFNIPGAFSGIFSPTRQATSNALAVGDKAIKSGAGAAAARGAAAGVRSGVGGGTVNPVATGGAAGRRAAKGADDAGAATGGRSVPGAIPPGGRSTPGGR